MDLLTMSISAAVMIAAIVILRALLIDRLPKTTFLILWAVVLLRLLVPVSVPSAWSVYSLLQPKQQSIQTVQEESAVLPQVEPVVSQPSAITTEPAAPAVDSAADEVEEITTAPAQQQSAAPTVQQSTPTEQQLQAEEEKTKPAISLPVEPSALIWGVGAAALGLYFVIGYWRATREFDMSLPVEHPFCGEWLRRQKEKMPLRRQIRIRQFDRIGTPLTYGVRRPTILLPNQTLEEQPKTLTYILTHEYVHIRRFDCVSKLLLSAALCLHWFNPLVWVMYVLANRDLELSCDEMVLRLLGIENRSAYAMALLEMEEKRSGFGALYSAFGKNAIEERIGAIMKMKKRSLLSVVMAVVLVFTLTACLATSPVEEETSAPAAEEKNTIESETVSVTSELTENKKEKIAEKEQGQSDAVRKRYIVSYWKEPQELYRRDYQAKGFRFEEDGTLYYKDQLVRYFVDGATVEPHDGSYTIDDIRYKEQLCAYLYEYYNEEGVIDLYTVRWEDRGTSSPTSRGLGELMKVEIFDPDTFDDRAFIYATEVDWENKTGGHNYILDDEIISAQATSDYKEENLSWDEKLEKLDALKEYGVTYEKIDEGIQMHYQGYLVNRLVYAGADVPHSFTLTSVGVPMERRASMSVYVDVSSGGEVEISNDWPLVGSIVLFRNYGIAYDEEQKAWAYNGQIIKYFIDGVDGQFPFLLRDDGEINLKVNYDENHYISGLEKISDEQAQALWEQAEAADGQPVQTESTEQTAQTQQLAADTTTAAAPIAPVKETTMVEDVNHYGDTNSRRYWAQEGTPVTCSVAGEVVASGWESGYGNRVQVQDASGIIWTYAHLKEISAQQGDQLQAGEQLGTVGHTGNAGSPTTYCLGLYAEKDGQELNVAQLFARGEEISL